MRGHTRSGDSQREKIHGEGTYGEWKNTRGVGTHIKNGNTRRGNICRIGTNTETGHTRRGDTHGVETYTEKGYRTYTDKGQIEWRHTWKLGTHRKGI